MFVVVAALAVCLTTTARLSPFDCAKPPDNGFISSQQMDFVCEHRKHWMLERDTLNSWTNTTMAQWAYLKNVEACTRNNCVKYSRRRKRETEKSIRKEIRMLTPQERERLFNAMNRLKTRMIDNITAWDLHTLVHYPDSAPGAHWGSAFLPWHREFLRQFEIALQQEEPSVTLPYWDSTLDQGLPDPADSVLFSDELLGNGNGYVKTGPFKDWDTNVLMPLSQIPIKKLYRSTGGRDQDRLMSPNDVEWIISRSNYSQLTFCHDKTFESIHGLSHVWVGGFMFVIRVSPNDPMFYMHHAFVDYLWEQFRRRSQTREERESQWATNTCNSLHGFDAQMKPFMLQNRDGLSNQYTDEWYDYQAVRHCTPIESYCDSPLLWCDVSSWRCRSKIVLGGNCTGFDGQPICLNSICQRGKCQAPPRVTSRNRRDEVDHFPADTVWAKTVLFDPQGNGITSELAKVTIFDPTSGTNRTSYKETNTKYPELPGVVYISLPKPRAGMLRNVTLEARDGNGRYCQAHCFNSTSEKYQVCQPVLTLGYRAETSSPISYTHSFTSRRFLDVDLSQHPRQLGVSMPYMVFACSRKLTTSIMITSIAERLHPLDDREEYVWFRVVVNRKDTRNLQIEAVSDNEKWSSSVRRAASSFDPTIVFVQSPNPARHFQGVRLHISILEDDRKINCRVKCTAKDGSMRSCDGSVELHSEPARSQESVFSSDSAALSLLGWDMRGHPQTWRLTVPYLTFNC